jgi:hypothetical protein
LISTRATVFRRNSAVLTPAQYEWISDRGSDKFILLSYDGYGFFLDMAKCARRKANRNA